MDVLAADVTLSVEATLPDDTAEVPDAFLVATLPDTVPSFPDDILLPVPPLTELLPLNTLSEPTLLLGPSIVLLSCPGFSGIYPGPCPW